MAHACGKVILLGEHAVVYGVPALAVGIERGADAIARPAATSRLRLGDREISADDGTDLGRAYSALLRELSAPALEVDVTLALPPGCGLGASAAISVAIARAAIETLRGDSPDTPSAELERVLSAATAWERVFHGNPSGIDAAASAYGGCISFTRGAPPQSVELAVPLQLAIAVAGPPASTREMVEGVAKLRQRRPDVVNKGLAAIESLVRNAKLCIEAGDLVGLGKLMDLNQMLLSGLFVSTEDIERACHVARSAGALGAKLTGAGGGGCVVALTEGDPDALLSAWQAAGFRCFSSRVQPGARARSAE